MVEAADNREARERERDRNARAQRRRAAWFGMITASYALDTLFLVLFALVGTVDAKLPIIYGAVAAAISVGTIAILSSGRNLHLRDPNMAKILSYVGVAMQLGVVWAAPQIAFPYLANLFTVFAFGIIWLPLRDSVMVWSLGVIGTAAVLYAVEGRVGVPVGSDVELALVWLVLAANLGRCLVISVIANQMRTRLADSRARLATLLKQVEQLATHDELTGVLNRRALVMELERECARAERSGAPLSIALIDLDHFKRINDKYGHAAGDQVLRAFAVTVNTVMRTTDAFGRYGGEEFLIVLAIDAPKLALKVMERIRAAVAATDWNAIADGLAVTLSAGIASYRKGDTMEQLLRRADLALYEAKHAGRNIVITSAA